MYKRLIIVFPILLCFAQPLLANGNCQAGLGNFAGAKLAFSLWTKPPGQNAVFVSGVTELNKVTVHDLHFSDRHDGTSDRVEITIDSNRSQLTTFDINWKDRRTIDLNCDPNSGAVSGLTGDGGVRLALARWSNPTVTVNLGGKADAIDAIPHQASSSEDLAAQAFEVIRTLTQSDPSWVAGMNNVENKYNLSGMNLVAYRLGVIKLLVQP
jgi:hypothetical protein